MKLFPLTLLLMSCLCIRCTEKRAEYFENGKVKSETSLRGGLKNGEQVDYFENGAVRSRKFWKEGLLHGEFVSFFPNGKKQVEAHYEGGVRVGVTRKYFENGTVERIMQYGNKGEILALEIFNPDGSRNPQAVPLCYLENGENDLTPGQETMLVCRLGNVANPSRLVKIQVIITSGFQEQSGQIHNVQDTLANITSKENIMHYKFKARGGSNNIKMKIIGIFDYDSIYYHDVTYFSFPYSAD